MPASSYVTVLVDQIVKETEKAFLIRIDGDNTWVPMACVADSDEYEEGMEGDISMSILQKFCDQEGIPYEEG